VEDLQDLTARGLIIFAEIGVAERVHEGEDRIHILVAVVVGGPSPAITKGEYKRVGARLMVGKGGLQGA
jgi:hypothetical protein